MDGQHQGLSWEEGRVGGWTASMTFMGGGKGRWMVDGRRGKTGLLEGLVDGQLQGLSWQEGQDWAAAGNCSSTSIPS